MKSKKELNVTKNEVEAVSESPRELTDEELSQVTGGRETLREDSEGSEAAVNFTVEGTLNGANK